MFSESMSLHAQCRQRIASTYTQHTLWRRTAVRHYVSTSTSDPKWFQQLRTGLLNRKPIYKQEDVNNLHREQLRTTLAGFVPRRRSRRAEAYTWSRADQLLTGFNIQVPSKDLLPDGTDPLHFPGEPWVRRMWAGGAVLLNPDVNLGLGSVEQPFRMACIERIKDVRLQGEGDVAKVFVTIERRFASTQRLTESARTAAPALTARDYYVQQVCNGVEWGDAVMKEERNLVFLKEKSDSELKAIQTGQTLAPKYLKCTFSPNDTDSLLTYSSA
jgi:hypothetical protein